MNVIATPGSDPIWSALPHTVPRHEWEVHLGDIHGHVEGLLRRVASLEGQSRYAGSDISGLRGQCHDLQATKKGHSELRLLFDVEVTERKAEAQQLLAEAEAFAVAQVEALKSELKAELEEQRRGLQSVTDEARRLNQVLMEKTATFEITFATKDEQQEALLQLRKQNEATLDELRRHLKNIEVNKASKDELGNVRKLLEGQCEVLRQDLNQSVHAVTVATGDVVELQRRCREELVHVSAMDAAKATLETVRRSADEAFQERQMLKADFNVLSKRITLVMEEQLPAALQQLAEARRSNADLSTGLNTVRSEVLARCAKVEEDLKVVDRRERSSWEQFYADRR